MGTGYTRNDTSNNIADGNVINASDLDGEFDAVQAAFNGTTGHSHDGTSGEGPQIDTAGIAADAIDGTKIADDSIDSEHYVDGSIDTAHIANDAVTGDKLANNIQIAGTLGVTGETTLTTHLNMGDNDIIKLGASADLQIYHDSTNSYLVDNGTGNLFIRGSNLILEDAAGNDYIAMSDTGTGGTVTLKHNASTKLNTKIDGVDITGELQSDSLDVDGNADISGTLTMGGNVDLQDNDKLMIGSGDDLQIYHDATDSRIQNEGNGHILIVNLADDKDVQIYSDNGSGGSTVYMQADGSTGEAKLFYYGSQKLSTKSYGVDITGELQADSLDIDGVANISSTLTMSGGNIDLGDSIEARFGASQDLRIYHDGLNSYIREQGTGNLKVLADDFRVNNIDDTQIMIYANTGADVGLFYGGDQKFVTKSDGVDITGELQADSLDIDGNGNISGTLTMGGNIDMQDNDLLKIGTGDDLQIYHDGSQSYIINNGSNNLYLRNDVTDKDVYIQTDDGSGGVALYFQADGSSGEARLFHYGTQKLNTKTDGVDITGELQCDTLDVDGNVDISGFVTLHADLDLQDNDKLKIGSSNDLQIFHDGIDSRIHNEVTGRLILRNNVTDQDIQLQTDDGSGGLATYLTCDGSSGQVQLNYYGYTKLNTVSDGIYVTGNVQSSTGYFEGASDQDFILIGSSNINFYINNSNEFRMESDGDFHADGDVIAYSTTISDERLKTDIEKIENATDKVSQLNGYTFTYKADGVKSAGVIAQEVEKVLPSAVREKELPLKMDDGVAYKTVQYDQIIGLLIESIKELKQEINELKGA